MFMPADTSALWSLALLLLVVVPECLAEVGLLPFGTAAGDSLVTSASSSYTTGSFAIPFPGHGPSDFIYSFSLTAVDAIFYGKFRVSLHSDAPFATPGTTDDDVGVPGIYRRQVSASLSTLYADLLPNGLLFSPTTALVMTFYKIPSSTFPSETLSVQVVILWNSVTYIVLFRMNELGPHINLVGGLFSIASNSYLYELPTVNATTTNVGVAGLLAFPPELVARTPTPSTSHSVDTSGSRTLSFHAWGLSHSATAAISMSVSHSASRTASKSKSLTESVTLNVSATLPSLSLSVSFSATHSRSPSTSPTQSGSMSHSLSRSFREPHYVEEVRIAILRVGKPQLVRFMVAPSHSVLGHHTEKCDPDAVVVCLYCERNTWVSLTLDSDQECHV